MEGFVPQKRPLFERLGGWLGVTFVAFLSLCLVLAFLYKRHDEGEEGDVAIATPPAAHRSNTKVPLDTEEAEPSKTEPEAPPPPRRPEPALTTSTGMSAYAEVTRPSPSTESSSVQVEFELDSRDVMDRLSQDGDGRLEVGRSSMSVVPQFKAKYDGVKSDPGFQSLASESRNLALGQPSLVFHGGKEPKSNETIGFYVEVTPSRAVEKGMEYKISIKRSLPDIQPTGEFKINTPGPFEETVSVPAGGAVLFAGLLPRKQQMIEGEDELYKGNILRALLDPGFEKGDNEFVILVNPHFSDPSN